MQLTDAGTNRLASLEAWAEFKFDTTQCPMKTAQEFFPFLRSLRMTDPEALVPRMHSDARPNSLSRKIGRGYQPPHTDGAHLTHSPVYVMLWAKYAHPDQARTHVRKFNSHLLDELFSERIRDSVWSVKTRSDRYHYSRLWHPNNEIKWDSGCFKRCANSDLTPEQVDESLLQLPASEIEWAPQKALIFNNRTVLHGRRDATGDANNNRELFRVYWYEQ